MGAHDHGSHDETVPEEPKTPMWLPALGAMLFLIGGIWFATRPSDPVIEPEPAAEAPAAASAAPAAAPPGMGMPGQAQPGLPGQPGGRPAAPAPKRDMPGHEGHGH